MLSKGYWPEAGEWSGFGGFGPGGGAPGFHVHLHCRQASNSASGPAPVAIFTVS
jgi:hypothetical protein